MKQIAIKAENISKQYRLGEVGTGTLSHDLNRIWYKIRGKEDPYIRIGEKNNRAVKGGSEYVWSLRDINFEIEQGDAVGIIGRNGAGKSTLLKLLSKVTRPTTGSFKVSGRVASLLEVGTGFNPEMTGRENIYLNGAILGMRRHEITRKLDEIIDFSGVERYIDTPVKRYSSGMYVRLAFAVAAHLESEILIVDEVLAVGDTEFQKKCLGKMNEVSKGEGRTVLFVSHNMAAVTALCNKGMLLDCGGISGQGSVRDIVQKYNSGNQNKSFFEYAQSNSTCINSISIGKKENDRTCSFSYSEEVLIKVRITISKPKVVLAIYLKDDNFNKIFIDELPVNDSGEYSARIPSEFLMKGTYVIDVSLYTPNIEYFDQKVDEVYINIFDLPAKYSLYDNADCGIISSPINWK
jgi:lipopolysaccharide transport system ATP-binding protein